MLARLEPILGKDSTTLKAIKATMFSTVTEAPCQGSGEVSL